MNVPYQRQAVNPEHATGVVFMTVIYGQFPWISLYLAGTSGTYGLLRKKSPLSATEGLCLETAFWAIPALGYLGYLTLWGTGSFSVSLSTTSLLLGSGFISGFPLIIYITAARLIPLSLIGILQYVYPTLIFISGYFVFGEPLDQGKITGFMFIWTALFIYAFSNSYKRAPVDSPT